MNQLEADLDAMLSAMPDAKTLAFGGVSAPCVVDSADAVILASGSKALRGKVVVATVRATAFPALKNGDTPTIDGVQYAVRDHQTEDDGLVLKVELGIV